MSEISNPSFLSRRRFLAGGCATALRYAPAIVRPTSLMQIRGIVLSPEYVHYGSVTRMWLFAIMPSIRRHQRAGLSADEIARYYNVRGVGYANGEPWDADGVLGALKLEQKIR